MKERIQEYLHNMSPAKLKKWILMLYVVVALVVALFFLLGRLNIIETLITYIILAICLIPVWKSL